MLPYAARLYTRSKHFVDGFERLLTIEYVSLGWAREDRSLLFSMEIADARSYYLASRIWCVSPQCFCTGKRKSAREAAVHVLDMASIQTGLIADQAFPIGLNKLHATPEISLTAYYFRPLTKQKSSWGLVFVFSSKRFSLIVIEALLRNMMLKQTSSARRSRVERRRIR